MSAILKCQMEAAFNVTVTLVSIIASGIASVAGFGIGSLLTPLVASHYGMRTAVGVVAVPHAVATLLRFWKLRSDVDWNILAGFGLMNVFGALAGALMHTRLNNPVLGLVLGALLVFVGLIGVLGYADRMRFGRKTSWIAGGLSGAFGGLVGNQGGIRSAAMLGLGVNGPAFVATATAIALLVDAVRMPVYFATESQQILNAWPAVVCSVAGVVLGTLVGERVLRRIPEHLFRRVVSGILLAVGAYLLTVSRQSS